MSVTLAQILLVSGLFAGGLMLAELYQSGVVQASKKMTGKTLGSRHSKKS